MVFSFVKMIFPGESYIHLKLHFPWMFPGDCPRDWPQSPQEYMSQRRWTPRLEEPNWASPKGWMQPQGNHFTVCYSQIDQSRVEQSRVDQIRLDQIDQKDQIDQIDRQIDRIEQNRQIDRQRDRQVDRQIDRSIDRQIDRQDKIR